MFIYSEVLLYSQIILAWDNAAGKGMPINQNDRVVCDKAKHNQRSPGTGVADAVILGHVSVRAVLC